MTNWILHEGDCLKVMQGMPNDSVDAVIADPPYSSGGRTSGERSRDAKKKYVQTGSVSHVLLPSFVGDNKDQRSYAYWAALWLSEALRLTKTGGVCAVFSDWRQLPVTTDALQAGGWIWRGIVPWHKPNGRPTKGRFANSCEYVVWGTKGPRPLDALGRKVLPGFLAVNPPRDRSHIAQKPLEVISNLVQIVPKGGTILDPFAGSGTTVYASVQEGRRAIGIEIDPVYCAMISQRMAGISGGVAPNGYKVLEGRGGCAAA